MSVIVPTLSVCSGKDCMISGQVNGVSANILVDTGAATTVLSKDMWDRSREQGAKLRSVTDRKLVSVQGTPLRLHGKAYIQIELPPEKFWIDVIVADTPTADVILGRDFLRSQRCSIEMKDASDVLHVKSRGQSVAMAAEQTAHDTVSLNVILEESVVVPPYSEVEVPGRIPAAATQKTWLVQGKQSKRCAAMVARALVEPEGNQIPLHLLNPRDVEVPISKGTILAELERVPEQSTFLQFHSRQRVNLQRNIDADSGRWWMMQGSLSVRKNHTLFATGDEDLGHTARHKIDTGETPPIRQYAAARSQETTGWHAKQ